MNMKKIIILLFTMTIPIGVIAENVTIDQLEKLYHTLDSLVEHQPNIIQEKQKKIKVIRDGLSDHKLTDSDRFRIQERLYNEYMAFKYDSAHLYATNNIALAAKMGDIHKLQQSKLRLVHILSVTGLFGKAHEVLDSIDKSQLNKEELIEYNREQNDVRLFESEFAADSPYYDEYFDSSLAYRKTITELAEEGSLNQVFAKATYIAEQGQYAKAAIMLEDYLKKLKSGDRNYSILTSTLAFIYEKMKKPTQQEYYLLLSSISDLRGAIRENNSMRELAMVLFEKGDYNRAFIYMNVSLNDAIFYGTRLRNLQVGQLSPKVVKAYQQMMIEESHRNKIWLGIVSVASFLLAICLVYIIKIRKRQQENAKRIERINKELSMNIEKAERAGILMTESNRIKDEYIGRFMELSSSLIDRADSQRKLENRLARDKKLTELYAELKSSKYINDCVSDFYNSFDTAFLNIYPTFTDEVNKLLSNGYTIVPKEEKLTTELRILALIRLGITDNQKIASILRSSITTIYTYRSKLKAKAIDRNTFEDKIKMIESYGNS